MTFATLDASRVCTESGNIAPDRDSCAGHEETAVEWMRETFAEAEVQGSAGIMFIFLDGLTDVHTELWLSLREELVRFGKPVVDIYRSSTPPRADAALQTAGGGPFANLTSVVTGGGEVTEGDAVPWMKIKVDTRSAEVFSFVPQTPERASQRVVGAATRIETRELLTAPGIKKVTPLERYSR